MTVDYKELSKELYEALKKIRYWSATNSEVVDALIAKYEEATTRCTGRTTVLYMKAITEALENPGKSVEFVDHFPHNWERAISHKERLENIINTLGLDIVVSIKGQARVYLYNKFGQ